MLYEEALGKSRGEDKNVLSAIEIKEADRTLSHLPPSKCTTYQYTGHK